MATSLSSNVVGRHLSPGGLELVGSLPGTGFDLVWELVGNHFGNWFGDGMGYGSPKASGRVAVKTLDIHPLSNMSVLLEVCSIDAVYARGLYRNSST